jgi:hypothetical protein
MSWSREVAGSSAEGGWRVAEEGEIAAHSRCEPLVREENATGVVLGTPPGLVSQRNTGRGPLAETHASPFRRLRAAAPEAVLDRLLIELTSSVKVGASADGP